MANKERQQHILALVMLSFTALVWGVGFLFSDLLLQNGFNDLPITLNALRFSVAAVIVAIIFCRKVRLTKNTILYGVVGGAMLFGGFALQLVGLKYTTPASCGFFTASYVLYVPFLAWIFLKKRPSLLVVLGVIVALAGLAILNINVESPAKGDNVVLGNMLTLGGSLFFAAQIVWIDSALKNNRADSSSLTVVQIVVCALLFIVSSLTFESGNYADFQTVQWEKCWWLLAIVSLLGTAFAYFSQTFAQSKLSPTETSIIIGCESPIGAVCSVIAGREALTWQICVGGLFVLAAVVLIEILPTVINKRQAVSENTQSDVQENYSATQTKENFTAESANQYKVKKRKTNKNNGSM